MPRMRWRLGELTTLPQTSSQLGGGHPQEPHASRRFDPRAFSARCSAPRF